MSILEHELAEKHVYEGSGGYRLVVEMFVGRVFYRFCSDTDRFGFHYTQVYSCKKATFKKWAFNDITDTIDSDEIQQALRQPHHIDKESSRRI